MNAHSQLVRDIQLACSNGDCRLFTNNVGEIHLPGRHVIYGLCPGSADLIGWKTLWKWNLAHAAFVALEVKTGNAKPTPAQRAFLDAVNDAGGVAGVVRSVADAVQLLGRA